MELTREERKRLAEEMRGLAMECLTNGPQMKNLWCGCAIGISMHRAGLWRGDTVLERNASEDLAEQIDMLLAENEDHYPVGVVSQAVRERIYGENPTAVVIPLLALADAVEEAPATVPERA